jgi:hypothetical protein
MKVRTLSFGLTVLAAAMVFDGATVSASGGFNEYGYNYAARIFVGDLDGADRVLDGMYWGDATYAADHLVMKWSKAWDDARFGGADWTTDAWVNNELVGTNPDGSGWTDIVKIVWIGPGGETSPNWREGGASIWGDFEVILESTTDPDHVHEFWAQASSAGYGGPN